MKNSEYSKRESSRSRLPIVKASEQLVNCNEKAKQVAEPGFLAKNETRDINSQSTNVGKFRRGILLEYRTFENMMRRSFQLSGSYDLITNWEDIEAAILKSKTPRIDASEKMANIESAVLTSYDPILPTATDGRSTSVSSTQSGGSSRTTAKVSPSSTPSSKTRTSRRRTIIFGSKSEKPKDDVDGDQEIGFGRYIPVKQGNLLKRTTNSINKEWKKKFVVLSDGGILTYYPSLHDYIANVHGKEIFLKQCTVKIPGEIPPIATLQGKTSGIRSKENNSEDGFRGSDVKENGSLVISNDFLPFHENGVEENHNSINHSVPHVKSTTKTKKNQTINRSESIPRKRAQNRRTNKNTQSCELEFSNFPEELQKSLLNGNSPYPVQTTQSSQYISSSKTTPSTSPVTTPSDGKERKWPSVSVDSRFETNTLPAGSVKKKGHRRIKSNGSTKSIASNEKTDTRNGQTYDYEFKIVSLDGKSWNFAASSFEERKNWVDSIEQRILSCLQSNFSGRDKMNSNSSSESDLQPIRLVPGNNVCADCGEPNPDWASLNLGALICIACCGFHRNLGTHVSRVRSLDLDEWPPEIRAVMLSIGNNLTNSIWEACSQSASKPQPSSPREDKERWIRAKYVNKEYVRQLPTSKFSIGLRLIEAVQKEDLSDVMLLLAHAEKKDVNEREDDDLIRTSLHISASKGNLVITLLLIWYFADVTLLDGSGRTALWYARESGSRECEEILKNNGCQNVGRSLSCSGSSNSGDFTS
ncbi:arf-GAP with GTPase, ANK repeat and PH domain-containing protein 3-like isoform X2 [Xenia sp. Carnegie-2017]|uniref:arf-GAP with GTPase, ANK repeat and PH domain-containing protein 3-like isoform X2 n=1 Tax=Xenia sp. Carnegie-2017 TaxID=2897299 RepID=UPI001F044B26|nr:arf-GAP with GTPase, ANK repeat and PH domain-containing protein 3-like isoform X2 [Xenia sp. Carnegie-2017]